MEGLPSPVAHGLMFLCCSLFPFAKVGVAGMSPLVRRGPSCVLCRGAMSASKRHKRGRFPKIKPSIPSRLCQCQRQARRCLELSAESAGSDNQGRGGIGSSPFSGRRDGCSRSVQPTLLGLLCYLRPRLSCSCRQQVLIKCPPHPHPSAHGKVKDLEGYFRGLAQGTLPRLLPTNSRWILGFMGLSATR